jgi:hypothetical protein
MHLASGDYAACLLQCNIADAAMLRLNDKKIAGGSVVQSFTR